MAFGGDYLCPPDSSNSSNHTLSNMPTMARRTRRSIFALSVEMCMAQHWLVRANSVENLILDRRAYR